MLSQNNKICYTNYPWNGGTNRLDYEESKHAITGTEVIKFGPPEYSDVIKAVSTAIKATSPCNRGVTIILHNVSRDEPGLSVKGVVRSVIQNSPAEPIFYFQNDNQREQAGVTNATEERMKRWLSDGGSTNLVTDLMMARGWEDGTVILIDYGRSGDGNWSGSSDNCCFRAISKLVIVQVADILDYYWDSQGGRPASYYNNALSEAIQNTPNALSLLAGANKIKLLK